jgi:hypothetical protein
VIPYIGITDFFNAEQVLAMQAVFATCKPAHSRRQLHVGVMISHKTLNNIPTVWQAAFPPKETIAEIFSCEGVYNCLHYADYQGRPGLSESLAQAIRCGGNGLHAVQLDMIWPDPLQVAAAIQGSARTLEVILQVGQIAFDQIQNDPQLLLDKLEEYSGVIHRVLLDKSMGRGLGMNATELLPFALAIRRKFPRLGLTVAGGLGPTTAHLAKPLVDAIPDVSLDAQGKLRPSGNALEPIDWGLAGAWLAEALQRYP